MITFQNASVTFNANNTKINVLHKFNAAINENDFTCILGPSGCGKTTILNLIAGFEKTTHGKVLINNSPIPKSNIKLSYVFQGHNIFPWKTVRQNIAFGLSSRQISGAEKSQLIDTIAKEVGLSNCLDAYPKSLSGGMKQRVGLARALVGDPEIILMDEPFAALDALTAAKIRNLLVKLYKERPMTIVFVTHNIDEALELGNRILVASGKPMKILIDKTLDNKRQGNHIKLKDQIYNTLTSDIID
jgi:ABC-type nitrate/sulfonate/bicarbonate transport system ATPase subunit